MKPVDFGKNLGDDDSYTVEIYGHCWNIISDHIIAAFKQFNETAIFEVDLIKIYIFFIFIPKSTNLCYSYQ